MFFSCVTSFHPSLTSLLHNQTTLPYLAALSAHTSPTVQHSECIAFCVHRLHHTFECCTTEEAEYTSSTVALSHDTAESLDDASNLSPKHRSATLVYSCGYLVLYSQGHGLAWEGYALATTRYGGVS